MPLRVELEAQRIPERNRNVGSIVCELLRTENFGLRKRPLFRLQSKLVFRDECMNDVVSDVLNCGHYQLEFV